MKVFAHQAKGMHLPGGLLAGFGRSVREVLPVGVVAEEGLATVAPIEHVMNRPRMLHSELPGMVRSMSDSAHMSIPRTDPSTCRNPRLLA
jgi:hypothetical protein